VLDVFIISLSSSDFYHEHVLHARARISKTVGLAKKFNWPVEIFPAVNGYYLNDLIWSDLGLSIPKKTKNKDKFGDKPGALGCFISHFLLWKHCANTNQPIIVLEDDADVISEWQSFNYQNDLVKLHAKRKHNEHPTVGVWSPGAFAYWISPAGANKLINFAKQNGPKYVDKMIGDNILDWTYEDQPKVKLRTGQGSSTNPKKYSYKN
jgi:hypothetical protein